jgi:multiple antibiotic resistance protein
LYEVALSAFVALFVIIDPIGNTPIFVALTQGTDARHRRAMAIKGPLVAMLILTLFAWVGTDLLGILGISMPAFKIAGGLMLAVIAFEMVFEKRNRRKSKSAEELNKVTDPDDISVCPIAIPMLAGPGSIATVMLLMGNHQNDLTAQFVVIGALAVVLATCLVLYLLSGWVERFIGQTISNVITRLLGVILSALAVQFVTDGLLQIFVS